MIDLSKSEQPMETDHSFHSPSKEQESNNLQEQQKIIKSPKVSTDVYLYRTDISERVFDPSNINKVKPIKEKGAWEEFIPVNADGFIPDTGKMPLRFFHSKSPPHISSKKNKSSCNDKQIFQDNDCNDNSDSNDGEALYNTGRFYMGVSKNSEIQSETPKVKYQPLKVKRLKGNELKTKRTKPPKVKKQK